MRRQTEPGLRYVNTSSHIRGRESNGVPSRPRNLWLETLGGACCRLSKSTARRPSFEHVAVESEGTTNGGRRPLPGAAGGSRLHRTASDDGISGDAALNLRELPLHLMLALGCAAAAGQPAWAAGWQSIGPPLRRVVAFTGTAGRLQRNAQRLQIRGSLHGDAANAAIDCERDAHAQRYQHHRRY
jgi:hypothetical protein